MGSTAPHGILAARRSLLQPFSGPEVTLSLNAIGLSPLCCTGGDIGPELGYRAGAQEAGGGIRMRRVDTMGDAQNKGGTGKGETVRHSRTNRRGKGNLEERWLERKVRDMYQEVVNEPVPQELLDIVKRIPKLED
jgi:Anti-sigma factor NepR